jgi:hypothetical protein
MRVETIYQAVLDGGVYAAKAEISLLLLPEFPFTYSDQSMYSSND